MGVTEGRSTRWRGVLRAFAGVVLAGSLATLWTWERQDLAGAFRARGLQLVGPVRWLDPKGFGLRRGLALAHRDGEPADVWVLTARMAGDQRVISVSDLSNLTRSRDAAEDALVLSGEHAAYVTRVGGNAVAASLVDLSGEGDPPGDDAGARFRASVTRWRQTGRWRGYGVARFDLVEPAPGVQLALGPRTLDLRTARASARIDVSTGRVLEGGTHVRARPRESAAPPGWVTWLVDVARGLPFVGPTPIAWAETTAFRAEHELARARRGGPGSAQAHAEVEADLADILGAHRPGARSATEGRVDQWPPAPLRSPLPEPPSDEGAWVPLGSDVDDPYMRVLPGAPTPMFLTYLRIDEERSDAKAYIVVWDPRLIELHVAPGSEEPMGATGETGTGAIPRDPGVMDRLVAGFNGAFQALHGEYGIYGEGMLLLPPKPYAATVALMADGNTAFGSWPAQTDQVPDDMVEFRQNLTAIVDARTYNPWRRGYWGGMINHATDLHTVRTGICATEEGYVAFTWGFQATPRTLGRAMLAARCTYGLHLDMNGTNTGFETYRVDRPDALPALRRAASPDSEAEGPLLGMPDRTFRARKLVRSMPFHLPRWIKRDPRDFFYLLYRATLPGSPLPTPVSPAIPNEGRFSVAGLGDVPFPWPIARTRVRPDPALPDRWVHLVRLDARRLSFAPADATRDVVLRWTGAARAVGTQPRISMTEGAQGPRWSVAASGEGIAGVPLTPEASALRGLGIDASGFLVFAVADRAAPGLIWHALDLAGCGPQRMALPGTSLQLPDGSGAAGERIAADARATLSLVLREMPRARRIFQEVTPRPASEWYDIQTRQVRYFRNPDQAGTMEVRLVGQQSVVLPLRGWSPPVDGGVGTPATP